MKKVCVFCGARSGSNSIYIEAAKNLGESFTKENLGLIYGGASIGMMGEVANAVLSSGGKVTGVITEHLMPLEGHKGVEDLRIVKDMHERKSLMYELSDGFAVLPGGIGTLEEFFEILTWAQLGLHKKPIGILNLGGYFTKLVSFLHHVADEGFVLREQLDLFFVAESPSKLLHGFKECF